MKILLLGANGQVGFELARTLAPLGELVCATRSGILPGAIVCETADLDQSEKLLDLLDRISPDLIVNAAAYTAVDRAEDEPELADRSNHQALAVLGGWAKKRGASIVHYSTDYVFDGRATRPYREDDVTAPLGVYGRSKLAGEQALRDSGCRHLILRTAWVYGARGQNFLRTMLRIGAQREQLNVVADQRGAPTCSRLIAATTAALLSRWLGWNEIQRSGACGIYHLSAAGECSWHEFASAIMRAGLAAGLLARLPQVIAITTAEYPTKAARPAYSVLNTQRLQEKFGLVLPPWQQGLNDVIGELAEAARG
ncbi:dTDP-4-dehydrorhamnose reductase [Pseudolysobacter antarcticus]|uniref:dTDP-4-dehydrorhamnose reductase n=1 Tax=Pseudolysobacter antarcticus TaxID=2511995 RepID=A0A411HH02_9GAMM|nr:dTDP-4-dehydrorhamnose reductase [Pseudolysobacter antarcticus]QBB69775.1 dTDP-4-dehydrorhamnose reductase [Pseudolysobacter antarcticus]